MADALRYYEVLQVAETADAEEIKNAYRDLAKKWHPDYNHETDTTDVFQKISNAYDILSHEEKRREYDILSLVYTQDNYPDTETLEPITDNGKGVSVRAVRLDTNMAWLVSYKKKSEVIAADSRHAFCAHFKTALINWLCGWWHPRCFLHNIYSLMSNFNRPLSKDESLKILLHNMIAYAKAGDRGAAAKCGLQAKEFLAKESVALNDFITALNVKVKTPQKWNMLSLKAGQLLIPALVVLGLSFPAAVNYLNLSEEELWSLFSKKKEIDYYQKVDFGVRGQSVDDVVVGKIMSIPVDKSDNSKLYHLTAEAKIMYGPSDEFDAIKVLKDSTTVRLTGITPDNVWARVMIDNGEIGFVRMSVLEQGIGKEVPFGSAIVE